ncbi:exodeoxyribonuclease VII small subunit [Bacillus sp. FSL W7-1360]|nr:exodeoxyribonuclease VII small subunit [Shouchella lonarensis]
MSEKQEQKTFEASMTELEDVVEQLERGEVPLEEALQMFKRGMALSKDCHEKLLNVERQLDQVMDEDGELSEVDLQKGANG